MNPKSSGYPFRALPPLLTLLLVLGLTACGSPEPQEAGSPVAATDTLNSVADVLAGDDRFGAFVTALDSAGLADTLRAEGSFTVFAPTDSAFDELPEGTLEALLQPENRDRLTAILSYHVAEGAHPADHALGMGSLPTLEGSSLSIGRENGAVRVGEATVAEADLEASNGIIHVIDAVLRPPADETAM